MSASGCGIARSLDVIGDWWSLLIVRDALQGRERFGEFQRSLGLAKNILSARLKKLIETGILVVEADAADPRVKRYLLTDKGERLSVVLVALWQWGETACFADGEHPFALVDTLKEQRLAPLEVRAGDGRILGPRDFGMLVR